MLYKRVNADGRFVIAPHGGRSTLARLSQTLRHFFFLCLFCFFYFLFFTFYFFFVIPHFAFAAAFISSLYIQHARTSSAILPVLRRVFRFHALLFARPVQNSRSRR